MFSLPKVFTTGLLAESFPQIFFYNLFSASSISTDLPVIWLSISSLNLILVPHSFVFVLMIWIDSKAKLIPDMLNNWCYVPTYRHAKTLTTWVFTHPKCAYHIFKAMMKQEATCWGLRDGNYSASRKCFDSVQNWCNEQFTRVSF